MKHKISSVFKYLRDKTPAAVVVVTAGYTGFQLGENYGEYNTSRKIEKTETSTITDIFTIRACPQLKQTDLSIGFFKPEKNIANHAYAFVIGQVPQNEDIPILSTNDKENTTWIYIDSPGGNTTKAKAFMDRINSSSKKVLTIVDGKAASAAFSIAISGTHGYRMATTQSTFMSHQASLVFDEKRYDQYDYPFLSLERLVLMDTNQELKAIIKKASPSLSEECVNALIQPRKDLYIAPMEALSLGLIDAVLMIDPKTMKDEETNIPMMVRKGDPREIKLEPEVHP